MITTWAKKWSIPPEAIEDLQRGFNMLDYIPDVQDLKTETDAQNTIRVKASQANERAWRNNVGAGKTDTGSYVRYGLCNDTPAVNKVLKSSDLIGIRPVLITAEMVGGIIGQFTAREVKRPGWQYTGKGREPAQGAFIQMITALGGYAKFTTGEL